LGEKKTKASGGKNTTAFGGKNTVIIVNAKNTETFVLAVRDNVLKMLK
jgi:hypothetical protein